MTEQHRPDRPRPTRAALVVLVAGVLITAGLSWLAYVGNSRNELRLLRSQVRQTGALLQAVVPTIQTPLASAVAIAASSGGDTAQVRSYLSGYVGGNGPFVAATLFELDGQQPRPEISIGEPTVLPTTAQRLTEFLTAAARSGQLLLLGPLAGNPDRLGYAYASHGAPSYVVYAESALPPHRRATIQPGSPFADLRFALYLGHGTRPDQLLETNVDRPLTGRTATTAVPFGGSTLTLVAGSSTELGGAVAASVWWIIAVVGSAFTATGAFSAQRLVTGRQAAERLTGEIQVLLSEQRTIAEALQHALLPHALPATPALGITARYLPGTDGVQIGGDWYDVVPLGEHRFFLVVGDVSGRGLDAGSVMASLMFAIRGFVSEGHRPAQVLDALSRLLDVERDGHFATVLCGVLDLAEQTLTIANAGHLPPLLVSAERTEFVALPTGAPIGVQQPGGYAATSVPLPAEAMLLAYTDGLVERRGETLDDGLRRLMDAVSASGLSGETLVADVMHRLLPDGCDDDTAVLALWWPR